MNNIEIIVCLVAWLSAGCGIAPPAPPLAIAGLPDCLQSNYDAEQKVFAMRGGEARAPNQKCLLLIGRAGSASLLTAGTYVARAANGGNPAVIVAALELGEGAYELTIGAGRSHDSACIPGPLTFDGGPGWRGTPTSIVRAQTGETLLGPDRFARPPPGPAGRCDAGVASADGFIELRRM